MKEEWRDIVNYEGYYQVSSFGNVRSVERDILRSNGINQHCKSVILKSFQGKTCNYLSVQLSKDNHTEKFMIHRLVAYAFLGLKKESNLEVNHIDGNTHNNRLDNLEIVTHQQNIDHSIIYHLKDDYGERSVNAKLTNRQVYKIREMWKNGVPQNIIAQKFHISKQTVCNVVHYKTYIK